MIIKQSFISNQTRLKDLEQLHKHGRITLSNSVERLKFSEKKSALNTKSPTCRESLLDISRNIMDISKANNTDI